MYQHGRSLVNRHQNDPFVLIGVNSDSNLQMVREVVADGHVTWRSFWNGPKGTRGPISVAWNVSSWPTIFLIDAEGRIRHRDPDPARLDALIAELIAEAKER